VKVSFGIYKIVGVQEAKRRGAGRRSLITNSYTVGCPMNFSSPLDWAYAHL